MNTTICLSAPSQNFEALCHILEKFLVEMAYTPFPLNPYNKELEDYMVKMMDSRSIRCTQLERTLHLAASFIVLCYPDMTMEEKKIVALFNWFLIYIDDKVSEDPTPFREFEQRFIRGLPQLDPVLDALVDILHQINCKWEDVTANFIIRSAMNFVACNCIEVSIHKDLSQVAPGNASFAWFLRQGTGVGMPYGTFGFTKSKSVGAMDFIHVMSDMDRWISLTNDLLSFYKEELNGDTNNYVHIRAKNENKAVLQVLSEIAEELVVSSKTIHAALAKNTIALNTWIATQQGYIQWHLIQKRYKLFDFTSLASLFPKGKKSK